MEEAMNDERFSHIFKDKRFRKLPKNVRKVTVDKRFQAMFKDKRFKEKCLMDERGRPLNLTPAENLKQLYDVSSESSENEDDDDQYPVVLKNKMKKGTQQNNNQETSESVSSESSENEGDNNHHQSLLKNKIKNSIKKIKKTIETRLSDSNENKVCADDHSPIFTNKNKCGIAKASKNKTLQRRKTSSDENSEHNKQNKIVNEREDEFNNANEGEGNNENEEESDYQSEDISDFESNNISSNLESERKKDVSSSSSEDSEESEDSDDSSSNQTEEFDHRWEELREEAPNTDETTRRLAICNMDWDRIRAEDLFAVFDSFKPANGYIYSVKIYPSEYGLKRMEEEKLNGPPELIEETLDPEQEKSEDKKGSKYHREKLRQYQINRLKYYYAVVDCDSSDTANALYEQLNGMEYESSSVRFDIRFIPDDVTFDHEPTSVADKIPDPTEYKPRLFVTTALQQVKVNLTWDETDPKRRETLQKAFTEPDSIEKDIKCYLASSSGESEAEEFKDIDNEDDKLSTKDRISKYRALLQSLEEKEKEEENKYEMEITWEPGLKEKTEKIVKERLQKDSLNPFEEMLKKKKEERKMKKREKTTPNKVPESSDEESDGEISSESEAEKRKKQEDVKKLAELCLISDSKKTELPVGKQKKLSKNKRKSEEKMDNFKIDVHDPRFAAIYSSHLYNIDPSDPHFKKSEGNLAFMQEKQQKLKHKSSENLKQRSSKIARYF